jgi:tetratricopeptide (TPR) repeat protein
MPQPAPRALYPALLAVALSLAASPRAMATDAEPLPNADISVPGEATPTSQRVSELQRAGKKAEALALADEALAKQPHDAKLLFLRALILGDLARTDEAIAGFERVTQEFPELPEAYNNIAVLRAGRGELAQAERFLRLAIAARPEYVTAQENLGDLYLTMARAAYERGSQLNPASRTLRDKLALARELGDRVRAAR